MAKINANQKLGSDGMRSSRSPISESVNKWKIPHYYKRMANSNTASSNQMSTPISDISGTSDLSSLNSTLNPQSNSNNLNSPKKMILEDTKKSILRSSKSNSKSGNEMVFVNYTVQDDKETNAEGSPISQPIKSYPIQKTSKRRMLKIFGSKESSLKSETFCAINGSNMARSVSSPALTIENNNLKNSRPQTKRVYSSFLTKNKSQNSKSSVALNTSNYINKEVVPKSKNNPSLAKPSNRPRTAIVVPGITSSPGKSKASNIPLLNSKKTRLVRSSTSHSLNLSKTKSTEFFDINSTHFLEELAHNNTDITNNESNIEKLTSNEGSSQQNILQNTVMDSPTSSMSHQENDASIAFSKMFSRSRANTDSSISQIMTPNLTNSNYQNQIRAHNTPGSSSSNNLKNNQRTLSIASTSSTNSRYSPIRNISPARARSSTKSSSSYRLSRDLSSLYQDIPEAVDDNFSTTLGADSFIDNQFILRSNNQSSRFGHKSKQDSITDLHKLQVNSNSGLASNSVTTPSTLASPPYFTSIFGGGRSNSVVSTPLLADASQFSNPTYSTGKVNAIENDLKSSDNFETNDYQNFTKKLPLNEGMNENQDARHYFNATKKVMYNFNKLTNDVDLSHHSSATSSGIESIITQPFTTSETPLGEKSIADDNQFDLDNIDLSQFVENSEQVQRNPNQTVVASNKNVIAQTLNVSENTDAELFHNIYMDFGYDTQNFFNNSTQHSRIDNEVMHQSNISPAATNTTNGIPPSTYYHKDSMSNLHGLSHNAKQSSTDNLPSFDMNRNDNKNSTLQEIDNFTNLFSTNNQ